MQHGYKVKSRLKKPDIYWYAVFLLDRPGNIGFPNLCIPVR